MINLSEDRDGFALGGLLRSAKEVKDQKYRKIFLQASELDSAIPRNLQVLKVQIASTKQELLEKLN